MHHFIYPQQDTFITNQNGFEDKNFGLNEILQVGTRVVVTEFTVPSTSFAYPTESVSNLCVAGFTGSVITASLRGTSSNSSGSVVGTSSFSASYFIGNFSGSFKGFYTGSNVSGSGSLTFTGFSGSLSGALNGSITGAFLADPLQIFTGNLTGFTGKFFSGTIYGVANLTQSHKEINALKFSERALVKFDISAISSSVASGDIPMPAFTLRMKVARAENLPLTYSVYALPISQSWGMGTGYYFDGGADKGATWFDRDISGSAWYPFSDSTLAPIDFISHPEQASGSWARGGGTWYTSSIASQSFNYEVGDLNMDVTNIVKAWISNSIQNQGFLLVSSDELQSTGSDMRLFFFSQDSNTIYRPTLDVGWNDTTFITGSVFTSSVTITTIPAGLIGTVQTGSSITGSTVTGSFRGFINPTSIVTQSIVGAINVTGLTGSINGFAIFGNITGSISQSISASTTQSAILGTLTSGYFSGSTFTSSWDGGVQLLYGYLSGSWNESQLIGNTLSASFPFSIFPNLNVAMNGRFIKGNVLGTYTTTNPTGSGILTGVITDGIFAGAQVYLPFSGSVLTASFAYTSSVVISSQSLFPVEFNEPFVTVVQNLPPTVKNNNIIRVNVFARQEFPLKNFNRLPQFSQFLTSQYLPTSSYYAIKDNETEEIVVDFDNYTALSCDEKGNYFLLDTTGLPQERYFKVLIKTAQSGSVYTFDRENIFKIVR